jgi:hypothetical protein
VLQYYPSFVAWHISCRAIYLALAASANVFSTGVVGQVIATEHEPSKAQKPREIWELCGDIINGIIDLREGHI